jgi:ParB/RepB/Spo0J family partition protein
MTDLKLPHNLAEKIAQTFNWKIAEVDETFLFEEDKQGYFYVKLKPKRFLDKSQFKTMCTLIRDLGGDSYLEGMKAWRVKGPCWQPDKTKPTVAEKSEPKKAMADTGFTYLPINALLSMPFQARTSYEGPEFNDLVASIKTYGVLEPILVRQKPSGLYEIAAGDRRVRAAEKAGLAEVPAIIKVLSDEEALDICLIENLHRKDLSEDEKSRALAYYAKTRKWNAQQIADHLNMSYTWVVKYLPDEFKQKEMVELGKMGGEARADLNVCPKSDATRRVANGHSEETREPTVPCNYCQEPIRSGEGVTYDGKLYHPDCADQVKAEKEPSLTSEPHPSSFDKEHAEPELEPEKLDTGLEITCPVPECSHKMFLIHVKLPNGKIQHKLEETE